MTYEEIVAACNDIVARQFPDEAQESLTGGQDNPDGENSSKWVDNTVQTLGLGGVAAGTAALLSRTANFAGAAGSILGPVFRPQTAS